MSNDLVVQLGAKLDQFQSDMNQAGNMADDAVSRIEDSFASLNPGINLTSMDAAFALITGGTSAALAFTVALNKSLSDTAAQAERAGLSLERIQQLQFGANAIGVGDKDFSSSLENFVTNLQNAKSKSNDLLRVFQANGVAITDSNGKLVDTNTLLTKAVDVIKRAPSIGDAIQMGSFLGISKQFSQAIYDTGDNFLRLASEANAAGAVIDDATIDKAKVFSTEWTKATALWSAQIRGALGDMLPLMNDLVNAATTLISYAKTAYGFVAAIKDFAIAPQVDTASLNQLNNLLSQYKDIKDALDAGKALNPTQLFIGSNIQNADHQITKDAVDDAIQDINDEIEKRKNSITPIRVPITGGETSNNPGIKQTNEAKDAWDRAQESVIKYTNSTNELAKVQGESNAALEEAKAQAQLLTGAQQTGIPVTQKVLDQIQDLKQDASDAAEALEKAKVAADISRGQQTAFLSPQDLAIANQLKGVYGNDIPAALRSSEAEGLRFNATIKDLAGLGQQVNSGFLVDFESKIRSGASAMDALKTAGLDALGKIADKLAQMAADNLWSSAFGGSGGGGLLSLLGITGGVNANGSIAGAVGPTSVGGAPLVGKFASGTDFAPGGLSLVGENGPEIMNVPRGAQIIPNDALKNGIGGSVTVHAGSSIVVQGSADAKTLELMRAELARRDAMLPARVVAAVKDAKARRVLA
ncbi:hypothetical protein J2R96_008177 [Bradyrhizobium elkanii]|nr:hypothetical protein [Bradyrhizobium elkanii]